jgi:hypothetical protein
MVTSGSLLCADGQAQNRSLLDLSSKCSLLLRCCGCARVTGFVGGQQLALQASQHCVARLEYWFHLVWLWGRVWGFARGIRSLLTHSRHCTIVPLPAWRYFVPADLQAAVLGCSTCSQFVLSVCLPGKFRSGCCSRTILWQRQCASRVSGFRLCFLSCLLSVAVRRYCQVGIVSSSVS